MPLQSSARALKKPLRLDDEVRFLRSWIEKPLHMGAVMPSGRVLARTMAQYVNIDSTDPVVELGPGTGAITNALIEHGVDQKRLVLVEYNPGFCALRVEKGRRIMAGNGALIANYRQDTGSTRMNQRMPNDSQAQAAQEQAKQAAHELGLVVASKAGDRRAFGLLAQQYQRQCLQLNYHRDWVLPAKHLISRKEKQGNRYDLL